MFSYSLAPFYAKLMKNNHTNNTIDTTTNFNSYDMNASFSMPIDISTATIFHRLASANNHNQFHHQLQTYINNIIPAKIAFICNIMATSILTIKSEIDLSLTEDTIHSRCSTELVKGNNNTAYAYIFNNTNTITSTHNNIISSNSTINNTAYITNNITSDNISFNNSITNQRYSYEDMILVHKDLCTTIYSTFCQKPLISIKVELLLQTMEMEKVENDQSSGNTKHSAMSKSQVKETLSTIPPFTSNTTQVLTADDMATTTTAIDTTSIDTTSSQLQLQLHPPWRFFDGSINQSVFDQFASLTLAIITDRPGITFRNLHTHLHILSELQSMELLSLLMKRNLIIESFSKRDVVINNPFDIRPILFKKTTSSTTLTIAKKSHEVNDDKHNRCYFIRIS